MPVKFQSKLMESTSGFLIYISTRSIASNDMNILNLKKVDAIYIPISKTKAERTHDRKNYLLHL